MGDTWRRRGSLITYGAMEGRARGWGYPGYRGVLRPAGRYLHTLNRPLRSRPARYLHTLNPGTLLYLVPKIPKSSEATVEENGGVFQTVASLLYMVTQNKYVTVLNTLLVSAYGKGSLIWSNSGTPARSPSAGNGVPRRGLAKGGHYR